MAKSGSDNNCWCLKPLYRLYHVVDSKFNFLGLIFIDLTAQLKTKPKLFVVSADHYYTSDDNVMQEAKLKGYKAEGSNGGNLIEGYCVPQPVCGATIPIYRFYSSTAKGIPSSLNIVQRLDFFQLNAMLNSIFRSFLHDSRIGRHTFEC